MADDLESKLPDSIDRLTKDPREFANKPRAVSNELQADVYQSLKNELGDEYFKPDEKGDYKRIEPSIQKDVKEKVIDSAYSSFLAKHEGTSIDRDTYVQSIMQNDLGVSEQELLQIAQSLTTMEEEHFKDRVSNTLGQRSLQAEINQLLQELNKIKEDDKASYVAGLHAVEEQMRNYAESVDYQGTLQPIKDVPDAQSQFNTIIQTAVGVETQKRQQAGYAKPPVYDKKAA